MSQDDIERNVAVIAERAVAGLSEAHRQRRIAYCVAHDEHGISIEINDELGTFSLHWGGEPLVTGQRWVLFADEVPELELVTWSPGEIPDTVAEFGWDSPDE